MNKCNRTCSRAPAAALLVLVLGPLLTMAASAADDSASALALAPGTRVRIEASKPSPTEVTGTINSIDEKTIRLDVAGHAEPVAVGRDEITRFRVSTGRSSRLVHALVGAAIGAIGGGVAANRSGGQHYPGTTAAAAAAVALAGAGIGAALPAGERWSDLPVERLRVAFVPMPGDGFRFTFSRGF